MFVSGGLLHGQKTIHVPGDQATIQSAINAANNGDTVLVADGTYKENIDFKGKAITVTSVNGTATTTIDGGAADTVVKFLTNEGPGSVLNGFTITNGAMNPASNTSNGGGVLIGGASPKITNNVIANNKGCDGGFGIFIGSGGPLIQGNLIANNSQSSNCAGGVGGGGIAVQGPSPGTAIVGNVIANNSDSLGGGLTLFASGAVPLLIQNNIFTGNNGGSQGGGIWMVNESPALIIQNLFIHNKADQGGAIFTSASGSGIVVLNNTMVSNPSPEGSGLYGGFPSDATIQNNLVVGASGETAVDCDFGDLPAGRVVANDIFGNGGTAVDSSCTNPLGSNGNVSLDPMFADATDDNYHLQPGSPVIDHGNNTVPVALPSTDLSGNPRIVNSIVDIGAFEFSSATAAFSVGAQAGSTTSATVAAGQSATYHLAVTGASGFSGTVTLTCSGAPQAASCSVSPGSLFVNGATSEGFTVTVQTTSRAAGFASPLPWPEWRPWLAACAPLLLCAIAIAALSTSRLRRVWPVAIVSLLGIIALTGCGGGGSTGGGGGGTPPGTSTIVVAATSGTSVQKINLTLQVN